jgi:hypothetical protein
MGTADPHYMTRFRREVETAKRAIREAEVCAEGMDAEKQALNDRVIGLMHEQWTHVRARSGATMSIATGWYHEIRRWAMEQCRKELTNMIGKLIPLGSDPLQEAEKRLALLVADEDAELGSAGPFAPTYRSIEKGDLPRAEQFQMQMEFDDAGLVGQVITRLMVDTGDHVTTYVPVSVETKKTDRIENIDTDGIPPIFEDES